MTQAKNWFLGTRTTGEAEAGIRRDTTLQNALHVWAKRTFWTALLVTVGGFAMTSGPILVVGALPAWGAFGLVKGIGALVDRDIRLKREAEERLSVATPAAPPAKPAPVSGLKIASAFKAEAVKKPAPAQPKSFFAKLGFSQ